MTDREKAIRYFQQSVDSAPIVRLSAIKEHVDACETALAALRAEEEREKGCEGCGGRSSTTRKLPYQCQYCCRNYCDQHDGRRGAAVELDGGGQDGC